MSMEPVRVVCRNGKDTPSVPLHVLMKKVGGEPKEGAVLVIKDGTPQWAQPDHELLDNLFGGGREHYHLSKLKWAAVGRVASERFVGLMSREQAVKLVELEKRVEALERDE